MSEDCKNCGAGLLDGQRFCRFCGQPTDQFPEDNVPTQMMNPDTDPNNAWGAYGTAPQWKSETSPVYNPQPVHYQSPTYQPPMPPYLPPRSRSPLGWIIGFLAMGLVGAVILAMFLFASSSRSARRGPPPPERPAMELREGENALGRGGTEGTGTFLLNRDSKISIENPNGNIKIEGWDNPEAEVRIIKRGGSSRERADAGVLQSEQEGNIFLRPFPTNSPRVQIVYEVRLPRNLRQVEIKAQNSSVEISDVNAAVIVDTQRGSINLSDINGAVSADSQTGSISLSDIVGDVSVDSQTGSIRLSDVSGDIAAISRSGSIQLSDISGSVKTDSVSGSTKVELVNVTEGKELKFNSISGSIEVEIPSSINAELEASTTSGRIDLDEDFGLTVEKQTVGQRVKGRIGKGGQPLSVSTTSGTIKIMKWP